MKPFVSIGAVVAALAATWIVAAGQAVLHRGMAPAPAPRGAGNAASNVVVISLPLSNWTGWAWAPAGRREFKVRPLPQVPHVPACPPRLVVPPGVQSLVLSNRVVVPPAPATVPPGVYETEPYRGVVVVPGSHPDDRSIIAPRGGDYSMAVGRPDLRFIPRSQAKK